MWEPAVVAVSAASLGVKCTRWLPSHTPSVVDPSLSDPPSGRVKPRSTTPTEGQPDSLDSFFVRAWVRVWVSGSVSMGRRMRAHNDRAHRAETLPPCMPSSAKHAPRRASRAAHDNAHGRHGRAHRPHLSLRAANPMDAHRGAADTPDGHGRAHRVWQWWWPADHHAR